MKIQLLRWRDFQHYKTRHPPWIRMYRRLLDDREYRKLSGDAKALLVDLWLLGSETADGLIEMTPDDLAWRLRIPEADMLLALQEVAAMKGPDGCPKWIEWDACSPLAPVLAEGLPEQRRTEQNRTEAEAESAVGVSEKLPPDYREDLAAMLRSCHRPESFRLEVATLVAGKHPRAEGATPEDVGRGIRELALSGRPHTSLAGFVGTITKRRREAEKDARAKAESVANERRKREHQAVHRGGQPAKLDLTKTLAELGIVPDKGAA